MERFKPQYGVRLNRSNPLAKGLVAAWLLNEGSGEAIFDLSGFRNHSTAWSGTPTFGNNGDYVDFDDSSPDYIEINNLDILDDSPEMTIIAEALVEADGQDHWIVGRGSVSYGDQDIILFADDSCAAGEQGVGNTDTFVFDVGRTTVGGNRVNGTTGLRTLDTWHALAGTMNGTNRKLYHNGLLNASHDSATIDAVNSTSDKFRIGDWESNNAGMQGKVRYVFIFNCELSADEIASLYFNPYQIFEFFDILTIFPLVSTHNLAGSCDGVVSLSDSILSVSRPLSGQCAVSASLSTAILSVNRLLSGICQCITSLSNAALSVLRALSGSCQVNTSLSDISIVFLGWHELSGICQGSTSLSNINTVIERPLSGECAISLSQSDIVMVVERSLSGECAIGLSLNDIALIRGVHLDGSCDIVVFLSDISLPLAIALSGECTGVASLSNAMLAVSRALSGSCDVVVSMSDISLSLAIALSGECAGIVSLADIDLGYIVTPRKIWFCGSLTGGGAYALDQINHNLLGYGHGAVIINGAATRFYYYDPTSSDSESSPDVIQPDSNSGDGRWKISTAT